MKPSGSFGSAAGPTDGGRSLFGSKRTAVSGPRPMARGRVGVLLDYGAARSVVEGKHLVRNYATTRVAVERKYLVQNYPATRTAVERQTLYSLLNPKF
ncbi:MAG: hypothetical protein ACREP7_20790 [Lysobacter sp.]